MSIWLHLPVWSRSPLSTVFVAPGEIATASLIPDRITSVRERAPFKVNQRAWADLQASFARSLPRWNAFRPSLQVRPDRRRVAIHNKFGFGYGHAIAHCARLHSFKAVAVWCYATGAKAAPNI